MSQRDETCLAVWHRVPEKRRGRWFSRKACPSLFGNLVRAALLHALDPAGAALHRQLFRDFLALTLSQQKTDLELYFSTGPGRRPSRLEQWLRMGCYAIVIPPYIDDSERELFLSNMQIISTLLQP